MELIVEVRSDDPTRPLSNLLRIPLGLDVWEANADRLVLRILAGEVGDRSLVEAGKLLQLQRVHLALT